MEALMGHVMAKRMGCSSPFLFFGPQWCGGDVVGVSRIVDGMFSNILTRPSVRVEWEVAKWTGSS
jgi:hypothetical protein